MTSKYPDKTRILVEEGLKRYFPQKRFPEIIYEAMQYSLFSGGKRLRAVLVIESAHSIGLEPDSVMPTACAVEFIHTYSLIHDDLPALDNDSLRRGVPTNHIKFGEAIAILAGDALLTEAFHLISTQQETDDPNKIISVIRELSSAAGVDGMIGGQVVDLQSEGISIDEEILAYMHEKKTGALITASVRMGAILAGAKANDLEALTEYSRFLGIAFQIVDDILDVVGDTKKLGKTAGSDLRKKKSTYPQIYGLEKSKKMANSYIDYAKQALEKVDGNTQILANIAEFVIERDF